MKKLFAIALAVLFIAPAAFAQQTLCYGWEDGGTILGSYGNLVDPTNVSGPQAGEYAGTSFTCPGPNSGTYYLHVAEDPHDGTPQAYVAWITGLTDGDVIDASFYGYDITSSSPSLRIWGHYALSSDINSYEGSAGGNSTYTDDSGWNQVSHTWTFDSDGGTRDALVIEARLYSSPSTSDDHTDFFIDDVCVTAPESAVIVFPTPTSPVEDGTWSSIKGLYR
ncbi:MAG: hypothetical protein GF405_06065 [Candidatus Eisenbacteria bacterium]|nr:hypothetical protein [Candidatus Eisenbacteria bacterium]